MQVYNYTTFGTYFMLSLRHLSAKCLRRILLYKQIENNIFITSLHNILFQLTVF